jgi:hypothetical protein
MKIGVFLFDQSTNHNAYPADALLASRMTLNPKVEKKWTFKDGWFAKDGLRVDQPMFLKPDENGVRKFKGIKLVSVF